MRGREIRAAMSAAVALCVCAMSAAADACPVSRGAQLVLVSHELDPDVFLWDSADRLARYVRGDFDVEIVLKHTTLIHAFSRAVAVGCRDAKIKPGPTGWSTDAPYVYLIGVRVISGRSCGRYGWVASSDVRGQNGRRFDAQRRH